MKLLFSVLSLLLIPFLAACALNADGTPSGAVKKPTEMTPAEACYNATLVVQTLSGSNVPQLYPTTYASAVQIKDELCVASTGME